MGRPTKPTALKLVEGNRGKRALNQREPDPTYLDDLTPPAWLSAAAAAVWTEVAPKLRQQRLLTIVDIDALALGCVALAQYRAAHAKCSGDLVQEGHEADPLAGIDAKGAQINPWLVVQSMSFKQAMAVLQQFGMSPAARTRIAIQPQGDLFDERTAPSSAYF